MKQNTGHESIVRNPQDRVTGVKTLLPSAPVPLGLLRLERGSPSVTGRDSATYATKGICAENLKASRAGIFSLLGAGPVWGRLLSLSHIPAVLAPSILIVLVSAATLAADEPPAINPFGPRTTAREDAVLGYLELSDGRVIAGRIYMTRDKRLKIYDESLKRQREIPLTAVKQIDCQVAKEWMEKEWRFKELTVNEKYYTGRAYPAREYLHTITLRDGRTITGPLAEIIYVEPVFDEGAGPPVKYRPEEPPQRFLLHKRDKGDFGHTLKDLVYVKCIKLGEEAYKEGKRKAAAKSVKSSD